MNNKLRYAMFPESYLEGKLLSQVPTSTVGDFDVVRNSIGTRVNKDGLIEVMDANVPRLDYSDGGCPKLLTEPSSTNYVKWSNNFDGVGWSIAFPNEYGISPDGLNNARKFVFPQGTSYPQFSFNASDLPIGGNYTQSIFIKKTESSSDFELVCCGKTITPTDEWQRVESPLVVDSSSETSLLTYVIYVPQGAINEILVYGGQVEPQSYATSYIPTNGTTATRQADQVKNAGNSSTFNSGSGVLFADVKQEQDQKYPQDPLESLISLSDGSGSNTLCLGGGYGGVRFTYKNDVMNTGNNIPYNALLQNKIAVKYDIDTSYMWINGIMMTTRLNFGTFNFSSLQLNYGDDINSFLQGKTKSIQHYDYLSDLEMEQLTGYDSYSEMTSQFNFNVL